MRWLLAPALMVSAQLDAQQPRPLDFDSRVETVEWREGKVLPLRTTTGGNLTVIFAPGETIQTVVVGDPGAIEVQVAPQADSMAVRTLRRPANDTIEVRSQLRAYRFRVVVGPANNVAYAIRFAIAAPHRDEPAQPLPPADAVARYQVKGEASLRPARVSDDGLRTYIEWGADQALPAVFALNPLGEEETVDSYIRQGVMVIDRVYPRLVFRIGKRNAKAERQIEAKGKQR